jgi:DNA-binding PadR family transcriptional regulator
VLTPLASTMLSLLCERPMHCYEMYRVMLERREYRIVKVKPGSLYHAMDRIVAAELAEAVGTDRDGARPERTTYRITDAGRAALTAWVCAEVAEPVNEFPRFPVAISKVHNLPRAEAVALVEKRISAIEAELADAESEMAGVEDVREAYLLDLSYLRAMTRAELTWLRHTAARLENGELEWPTKSPA